MKLTTSQAGITSTDAATKVRVELDHNRRIALGYKSFWDKKTAEDSRITGY